MTLTGLIVGFYFATSGALEFIRIREAGKTRREQVARDAANKQVDDPVTQPDTEGTNL